ncbi:MAG: hypothetical protein CMA87_05225 [Euryarchaeota archaeon]|nr:hypothetical protein [Euryarchaeota archaeon]
MGDGKALPDRTEVVGNASPWLDRVILATVALFAIISVPYLASSLEGPLGSSALLVTSCGLMLTVPIISTFIGKRLARILSD